MRFCMTYGDGVADVNIKRLLSFHFDHGKTGDRDGRCRHQKDSGD